MSEQFEQKPFYAKRYYRLISAGFGLFLAGVGVYVLLGGGTSAVLRWIGGLALLMLGGNMSYAALNARESWLSKLGPLA